MWPGLDPRTAALFEGLFPTPLQVAPDGVDVSINNGMAQRQAQIAEPLLQQFLITQPRPGGITRARAPTGCRSLGPARHRFSSIDAGPGNEAPLLPVTAPPTVDRCDRCRDERQTTLHTARPLKARHAKT